MSEEDNEAELNHSYLLGQSAGLKEAASVVMARATSMFLHGDILDAGDVRDLAKKIEGFGITRHPGFADARKEALRELLTTEDK